MQKLQCMYDDKAYLPVPVSPRMCFLQWIMAMTDRISVTASAAGNASQMPVIAKSFDRINAKTRIATEEIYKIVTAK